MVEWVRRWIADPKGSMLAGSVPNMGNFFYDDARLTRSVKGESVARALTLQNENSK